MHDDQFFKGVLVHSSARQTPLATPKMMNPPPTVNRKETICAES